MSDERFARQYRFELPSGFPLTSPCTSIVHHLSGPNIYAHPWHFTEDQAQAGMHPKGLPNRFPYAFGFSTLTLAHMLDSLVRVSRRVGLANFTTRTKVKLRTRGAHKGALEKQFIPMSPVKHVVSRRILTEFACSGRFHVLFTFFSKSFSSFPHGTCALSVFLKYLALEGFYLPFSTAIPSNTTLSCRLVDYHHHNERGLHPL